MQLLEGDGDDAVAALTAAYRETIECREDEISMSECMGLTPDLDQLDLAHDIAHGTLAQLPSDPEIAPHSGNELLGQAILILLAGMKADKGESQFGCCDGFDCC